MEPGKPQTNLAETTPPGRESQKPPEAKEPVRLGFELPSGEHIRITIECLDDQNRPVATIGKFDVLPSGRVDRMVDGVALPAGPQTEAGKTKRLSRPFDRLLTSSGSRVVALPAVLFAIALLAYFSSRVIGLTRFPIYFFTDEAVQTMLAADLVRDNFHGGDKVFLPTYFKNGNYYNLSTSVYLQVLPYVLFGRSIFLTRLVSVLVSLLAAVGVGLMLRDFYKIPYWWSGTLLLSITPAWFLHSRTAFETVIFVSLYAGMLFCYISYRFRSPRWLYPTLVMAALAFYSYSPGQVVVATTGLLLALSDFRYHWENRRTLARGVLLGALLVLPYLRFRLEQPEAAMDHLRLLGSYLMEPAPAREKLARFASEYLYGLSPGYWFIPNQHDLPRHLMKGYGHMLRLTLPFAFIGLVLTLVRLRRPEYRLLLIALLVGPLGSALVGIGITRVLVMVIPAALLTALGIAWVIEWLERPAERLEEWGIRTVPDWLRRWKVSQSLLSVILCTVLLASNFAMLADALRNGPTWFRDYGLGGLQYGAAQVFAAIRERLEADPEERIIFSPTWANGTDVLARFFLDDPLPIEIGSVEGHMVNRQPLDENTLFISTPYEYQQILESGKFKDVQVDSTLPYPDGTPGFYFLKMSYIDDVDAIFAAEQTKRRELQESTVKIDGQDVRARYPMLDMGDISLLFDGDVHTMLRTMEANPLSVELEFPGGRQISGFSIIIGSANVQISASAIPEEGIVREFLTRYRGSVDEPEVRLDFAAPLLAKSLRIDVLDLSHEEPAHVHAWEIEFH